MSDLDGLEHEVLELEVGSLVPSANREFSQLEREFLDLLDELLAHLATTPTYEVLDRDCDQFLAHVRCPTLMALRIDRTEEGHELGRFLSEGLWEVVGPVRERALGTSRHGERCPSRREPCVEHCSYPPMWLSGEIIIWKLLTVNLC